MNKLHIYCFTSKTYRLLDKLPQNIIPVGLGNKTYPVNYLKETNGQNLSNHNKYFAEMSGIYWVFKNRLQNYDENDYIGFCHYRRFWLDNLYPLKHNEYTNIYSKLLKDENNLQNKSCDTFLLDPTKLKNENIYDHFINNHGGKLLNELPNMIETKLYEAFLKYTQKSEFSACNMFITKPKYFRDYCEFIFPFLDDLLKYCLKNDLCKGANIKLPAYFIERFTSFWFHHHTEIKYLSYAQLGKFFTSNIANNFVNTLKTPLSFLFYPTSLDI